MKKLLIVFSLFIIGLVLLYAVVEMPPIGNPNNPPNLHVVPRYIEKGAEEAVAENIIAAIVLNYRGYDTMGEVTVIFTALCSVLAVLGRERLKTSFSEMDTSSVKPSMIVQGVTASLIPFIMLFAIYVILHGDVSPGGGFQGGTILGAVFIVFVLVFGLAESMKKLPPDSRVLFESIAPISFILVGLTGLIFGANFLTFKLPGLSSSNQIFIAKGMLLLLGVGIGAGGGLIFTSIFFSMHREER